MDPDPSMDHSVTGWPWKHDPVDPDPYTKGTFIITNSIQTYKRNNLLEEENIKFFIHKKMCVFSIGFRTSDISR